MNKSQLIKSLRDRQCPEYILSAFSKVPRERFVPKELRKYSYDDRVLPIDCRQTISQPSTIAIMLLSLELKEGQKVLEVGSGSGYVLALISEITKTKVYGIERIKKLAEQSRKNLRGYDIEVYCKDGADGLGEHSPFEKILLSATCKDIDAIPEKLLQQLTDNGILLTPIGLPDSCSLTKIQRQKNEFKTLGKLGGFRFVPFIVEEKEKEEVYSG